MRDEAALIVKALRAVEKWRHLGHEIIVVDGDSTDCSCALAAPLCDRLVHAKPSRAGQMNAGAAAASGELLLFLHADTTLPDIAVAQLATVNLRNFDYWGHFDVRLDAQPAIYRVLERLMNWRSRLTGIATGDQAIFVSRSLFKRSGGFPNIVLMEDIALSAILRRLQAPKILGTPVLSSARRWQRHGVARTILTMWSLRAAFYFGVSPHRLRAFYQRRTHSLE